MSNSEVILLYNNCYEMKVQGYTMVIKLLVDYAFVRPFSDVTETFVSF